MAFSFLEKLWPEKKPAAEPRLPPPKHLADFLERAGADWPKAVALIRQGYTPAAALAALGYSASSMAEERR